MSRHVLVHAVSFRVSVIDRQTIKQTMCKPVNKYFGRISIAAAFFLFSLGSHLHNNNNNNKSGFKEPSSPSVWRTGKWMERAGCKVVHWLFPNDPYTGKVK